MFKNHKIKSNITVLRKNSVDTYGPTVFVPDCSATCLATKICPNSNEHSMYIRFLCIHYIPYVIVSVIQHSFLTPISAYIYVHIHV
jgi:hypothetical protein